MYTINFIFCAVIYAQRIIESNKYFYCDLYISVYGLNSGIQGQYPTYLKLHPYTGKGVFRNLSNI